MTAPADTLRRLERGRPGHDRPGGTALDEALEFFDALPAVAVAQMLGHWRGGEIPTGNPMEGLLGRVGWHGKRFDSADDVHPLVMARRGGGRYSLDPALLPLPALLRRPALLRSATLARLARAAGPALATRAPKARLRTVEYRGVASATMCYDDLPIHDAFRAVDDDTVVGAMDLRGLAQPFLFWLRRE